MNELPEALIAQAYPDALALRGRRALRTARFAAVRLLLLSFTA